MEARQDDCIENNASRKCEKNYHEVKFINISISSLGILGILVMHIYIQMYKDLDFDKKHFKYILKKFTTITIRATYYIFCTRNKPWINPELLTY